MFFFSQCNTLSKETNSLDVELPKHIQKILLEKSKEFIEQQKNNLEIKKPLYVMVTERSNLDMYEFSINVFDILLIDDDIPCTFSKYSYVGENIIYFYYNQCNIQKEKMKENLLKNELMKKNMIVNIDNNRLNDFVAWNLFICKTDHLKIKIIKSPYIILDKDKPKDLCPPSPR